LLSKADIHRITPASEIIIPKTEKFGEIAARIEESGGSDRSGVQKFVGCGVPEVKEEFAVNWEK
jgi:hypothetical protein